MIQTQAYKFVDGRIGTKTFSDKLYKNVERINENGEKVIEPVYYYIRKVGTNEVYSEAIDILSFKYEEVTEEKMKELIPEIIIPNESEV